MTPPQKKGRPPLKHPARVIRDRTLTAELNGEFPNLKAVALTLGTTRAVVGRDAGKLGWRTMWVSAEERRALLAGRKFFAHAAA